MESFPSILTDKLTGSVAHGQLIGGGCFAIAIDRLRAKGAPPIKLNRADPAPFGRGFAPLGRLARKIA